MEVQRRAAAVAPTQKLAYLLNRVVCVNWLGCVRLLVAE
jgi:hypothetical protein